MVSLVEEATLAEEFINGTKDKTGQDVSGSVYKELVQSPAMVTAVNAGLFDETALDPYELAATKVNIEGIKSIEESESGEDSVESGDAEVE